MNMHSIKFALPTLAEEAMGWSDQDRLIAQQVTAAIVCGYLEHMNAAIAHGTPGEAIPANRFISPVELVSLINDVQTALRTMEFARNSE
jgi:hypothetical protein